MNVLTLLLHDERFSGWTIKDKLTRKHFSLDYIRAFKAKGWESYLYTFHESLKTPMIFKVKDSGTVKIFPVKFRIPPFLRFGNDHNPRDTMREALSDQPDIVHFHNYYLLSFPYTAMFIKEKLRRPLTVQLHGYDNNSWRKWLYAPCLLALRKADRILYSYSPEQFIYKKLRVMDRAVKIPVPGVDTHIFKRSKRHDSDRLLYVGRVPRPETAFGEKSPVLLLHILRNVLKSMKDVTLDVVGDGPGLHYCRQLASKLEIEENVIFHGYVSHNKLPRLYQESALTFSPIRVYDIDGWFDGAIQESLACGTPAIAFKAWTKTPHKGTYGFLLSHDVDKASKEVVKLLKARETMNQIADDGSRFVHKNCTRSNLAHRFREYLEDLA